MARISSLDKVQEEADDRTTPPHSAPAHLATQTRPRPPRSLSYDRSAAQRRASLPIFASTSLPSLRATLDAPIQTTRGPPPPLAPHKRPPSRRKPTKTMIDLSQPFTFDRQGYKNRPFSAPKAEVERTAVADWSQKLEERRERENAPVKSRIMDFDQLDLKHRRRLSEIQQGANTEIELEASKREQKEHELKAEQARRRKQRRGGSHVLAFLSCGLLPPAPSDDKKKTSTPKVIFTPPTPVKHPPSRPAPTSAGANRGSKRMSAISRVEEWKRGGGEDLLQPPARYMMSNGGARAALMSRSAPELVGDGGAAGGKHSWLEY